MSNLHEITTQGSGISLGPVTVTKAFAKFAGSSSVLVLVSDPSVQNAVALKVWGPASNTAFSEGMVITLQGSGPKGKLEYKDYKGKMEINANDCNVLIGGGAAPQHAPQSAPAPQQGYAPRAAASSAEGAMNIPPAELSARMDSFLEHGCEMTTRAVDVYIRKGFSREEAITLSAGTHGTYPTSWFLQKGF